ncbi:cysteine desulfurase [Patescibacteria group bacterium]|nr:cysteine desulfurase [Patescibacteria group bacterium]
MWFRKKRIYADAAAATPLSARAKGELLRLLDVYGNAGALHKEGVEAKRELEDAREVVAKAIGAHPDEMVFTGSGTEGNNLTLQGILRPYIREGKPAHAITSVIEHSSVLEPLRALTKEGLQLTELAVDSEGLISPKELAEAITEHTVLISIQYINSEIGTIEPIREIAKEIRRIKKTKQTPIYFHTDASQAPLWLDLKVESLGVDLLTLDAQKIMGPKGVGALYIKRGVQIEPLLLGSKQERGLRGGTENVPLVGAFAVALKDASKNVVDRAEKTAEIRNYLWNEIKKRIPEAELNGPEFSHRAPNNLNISILGLDREMAVLGLDAEGVAITTRSACNVADSELSYVVVALGDTNRARGAIRITLLPDATKRDADTISAALEKIAKRYTTAI